MSETVRALRRLRLAWIDLRLARAEGKAARLSLTKTLLIRKWAMADSADTKDHP
jgi:hypothetical protein